MSAAASARTALRVDAMALGLAPDPYPEYAVLRRAGRLVAAGPGTFAVGRHEDVSALLRDPDVSHRFPDEYRRFAVGDGATTDLLQRIVSSQVPPEHGRIRARLGERLSSGTAGQWPGTARGVIDAAVGPLTAAGHFDAVADLANPLAVRLTGELFGLSTEQAAEAAGHAVVLGRAFTALRLNEDDRRRADAAVNAARGLFAALEPDADQTAGPTRTTQAAPREPAEPDPVIDNLVFLYYTAAQMLAETIATSCAILTQHPDQLARLRADPGLAESAVHEVLRFDSPTQGTARLVTAPVEVGDRTVRPGRVLFLLLGSANRDERVFADPDRLDIGRSPNPHLGFGGGPYRCLGEAVAVGVGADVLRSLLEHADHLAATAPPRRLPADTFCRSYASIPLATCPAPAPGTVSAVSPEGSR